MTQLGTCMKCRSRTVVSDCKVEAFKDEARPVIALLCAPCIAGFKVAIVTPCFSLPRPALTLVYS